MSGSLESEDDAATRDFTGADAGLRELTVTSKRSLSDDAAPHSRAAARWRWSLIVASALVPAGAFAWTVHQPPVYRSQAVIDYGRDPLPPKETPTAGDALYEWKRTQDVVLTSSAVLGRAVDKLESNASSQSAPSQRSSRDRDRAVDELRKGVRVAEVPDTTLCRITYDDVDSLRAARVANAIVDAYLERSRETRAASAQQKYAWFSQQIEASKRQLGASEIELEAYHAAHPMPPIPLEARQRMLVQEIEALSQQQTEARLRRIQQAARLAKITAAVEGQAPFEVHTTEVDTNEQVKQLRSAYVEQRVREHELGLAQDDKGQAALIVATKLITLRAEMHAVLTGIQASVKGDYAEAQQIEEQLGLALQRANTESKQLQSLQLEYGRLQRERAGAEALLKALSERASTSAVTTAADAMEPKLVEAATAPHEPVPRPWFGNMVLAGMLALGLFLVGHRLRIADESLPS